MLQSAAEDSGVWGLVHTKGIDRRGYLQQVLIFTCRTYGMLKPNAYLNFGKMIAATEKEFTIANLKLFQFDEESAGQFYGEHKGKSFYPTLINFMTSDFSLGMELIAPNAITKWRKFIGPTNSQKAREEAPSSMRALYGEDGTKNACHGSDAPTSA